IGRSAGQKLHHADGAPWTMGRLLEARLLEALRRHHQIVEAVFVRILLEDADDALEFGLILLAVGVLDDRSAAIVFTSHLGREARSRPILPTEGVDLREQQRRVLAHGPSDLTAGVDREVLAVLQKWENLGPDLCLVVVDDDEGQETRI